MIEGGIFHFRQAAAGNSEIARPERPARRRGYLNNTPPDRRAGSALRKMMIMICLLYMYIVADNGEKAGIMSSCNEARALLQVCYRWGEIVDLIFWVW